MKYYVYTEKDASKEQLTLLQDIGASALIREPISQKVFGNIFPENADYFVCPIFFYDVEPTEHLYEKVISGLVHFKNCPEKHIFFDLHDSESVPYIIKDSIVYKVSSNKHNKTKGLYYPVPFLWYNWITLDPPKPIEECRYDVSFQGGITCDLRKQIPQAIQGCKESRMQTYLSIRDLYFFSQTPDEKAKTSFSYYNSIIESKFVLCPRGAGISSWRTFECLAAGRIPIIISDSVILPLEDRINWNLFSVRVPEAEIEKVPEYIQNFLQSRDLSQASKMAQETWMKYFTVSGLGLKNFLDKNLSAYFLS